MKRRLRWLAPAVLLLPVVASGCGGDDELTINVSALIRVQGVNTEAPFSAVQLQEAMVENLQASAPEGVTFEGGGDGGNVTPAGPPPAETTPAETPPGETPPAETPPAETPPAETPAPGGTADPGAPAVETQYQFAIFKGRTGWRWAFLDPLGNLLALDPAPAGGYESEAQARQAVYNAPTVEYNNITGLWTWSLQYNGQTVYFSPPYQATEADARAKVAQFAQPVRYYAFDDPESTATLLAEKPPLFNELEEDEQEAFAEALGNAADEQGASGACRPDDPEPTPECVEAATDVLMQESVEDLAEEAGESAGDLGAGSGGSLATVAVANAFVDTTLDPEGEVQTTVVAVTSPPEREDDQETTTGEATAPEEETGTETGITETAPLETAPVETAPVEPAPVEPAPVEPEPAPVEPAPTEP